MVNGTVFDVSTYHKRQLVLQQTPGVVLLKHCGKGFGSIQVQQWDPQTWAVINRDCRSAWGYGPHKLT